MAGNGILVSTGIALVWVNGILIPSPPRCRVYTADRRPDMSPLCLSLASNVFLAKLFSLPLRLLPLAKLELSYFLVSYRR
jgi:hypothetical protein